MKLKRGDLWKIACLAGFVMVAGYFVTIGREPLNALLDHLRHLGAVPFFGVFALCISAGVPPTPFLLAAGAVFELPTNLAGLVLSYAISLSISFLYANRLFKRQLSAFLTEKAPLLAGILQESPVAATVLVRLIPGFPYVLQNCFLVSISRSFAGFFLASMPPLMLMSVLYTLLGKNLVSGNYVLFFFLAALLLGLIFSFRYFLRRRSLKMAGVTPEQ